MGKVRRFIATLTTAAILITLLPIWATSVSADTSIPPAPFADVYSTKYQDAVGLLYLIKVAQGTAPFEFSPYSPVTRAQMAAFLLRALGQVPSSSEGTSFTDVPAGHWAAAIVARAANLGLVKGDASGLFRPEAPVSHAEAATMLIRALGYDSQVPVGEWPVNYVLKANELGLLAGVDFRVTDTANRGDVSILLANAIFKVKEAGTGKTLNARIFQAPASVRILPDSSVISAGNAQLTLEGVDWFGSTFAVSGTWSTASTNARVDSAGNLTITAPGTVVVEAQYGELKASRTYVQVQGVAVSPTSAILPAGATKQFTATGQGSGGEQVSVPVTWSVTGPGTINTGGLLTVTGAGNITVTASVASMKGQAAVTAVNSLSISPALSSIALGQSTQFTATGTGGVTLDTPITWSIVSGGGSLSSSGEYTPGSLSHVEIQAAAGSVTARSEFDVTSGLRIQPETAAMMVGTTQTFKAQVQTATGWKDVTASWSLSNPAIGVLGSNGLMAATGAGSGAVTAKYGNLTATAPVTVSGAATSVKVTASRTNIVANGASTATITATFVDASGFATAAPTNQVLFLLSTSTLGSLSAYTATVSNNQAVVTFTTSTTATSGAITAYVPGTSLTAGSVNINTTVASPSTIQLSAYPSPIASDSLSKSTITATLLDQDGQAINNSTGNSIGVNVNASGSAGLLLGSIINISPGQSSGTVLFQAGGSPGASTITGAAAYTVRPVTLTSVTVGAPAQLAIRQPIANTVADNVKTMPVTVEVQDANGNVVTGNSSVLVSLIVTGPGSITPSAQTVSGGTTTFNLKTTKAGTYTLKATSLTDANLAAAQASAAFIAGPAASLTLSLDPNVAHVTADGATAVRLMAKVLDANANIVTSATNAVTFTQNSSSVFFNIGSQTVNAVNGIATLSITPKLFAGSDTFSASSPGLSGSPSLTVATKITGPANKVAVQSPGLTSVTAGQSFEVSVWIKDSLGQIITNDSGRTVALVLSDGSATSNSPQQTKNGVATFTVTPTKSGSLGIRAQSTGLVEENTTVGVTVGAALADHIKLTPNATSAAADGTSTISIMPQVVDVYGNPVGTTVGLTLAVSNGVVGHLNVTQTATSSGLIFYTTTQPGTVTISGIATYPVVPITLTTYVVGQPTRIVVDPPTSVAAGATGSSAMQVTVRIADSNGNTVTSVNSGVGFGSMGIVSVAHLSTVVGSSTTTVISPTASYPLPPGVSAPNGTTTGAASIINGRATFTFTDTKAETVTFIPMLSIGSTFLTPTNANGTITPGVAASVVINSSPAAFNALTSTQVAITASLADAYGNTVQSPGDTFTFTLSTTQFLTPSGSLTVPSNGGGATISLTSKPGSSGVTNVTAVSANTGLTSSSTPIVQDLLPDKPTGYASAIGGGAMYAASAAIQVFVSTSSRQAPQTVIAYLNGVQVPLYTTSGGGTLASPIAAGSTTLTAYILQSNFGGAGAKSLQFVIQSSVGTGPVSDPYNFQLQ